jgi:hypothetical protein
MGYHLEKVVNLGERRGMRERQEAGAVGGGGR